MLGHLAGLFEVGGLRISDQDSLLVLGPGLGLLLLTLVVLAYILLFLTNEFEVVLLKLHDHLLFSVSVLGSNLVLVEIEI